MLEAALISASRVLKVILTINPSKFSNRVKIDNALEALRQIFFFPSELLVALDKIANGQLIDRDVAQYFAEQFSIVPQNIQGAFAFLDADKFQTSNSLMLSDLEKLMLIQVGKISIRREINKLFAVYLRCSEGNGSLSEVPEQAARIIAQIHRLNDLMKKVEKTLRVARSEDEPLSAKRAKKRL